MEQHFRAVEARPAGNEATQSVLLHQVAAPIVRQIPAAAVAGEDAAIAAGDDGGEAVERPVGDLVEPGLPPGAVDRRDATARDADQQPAVRMAGETAGIDVDRGKDTALSLA